MFLVGLGVFGYLYVEDYTRPYRELAEKYDLELINEVEEHSSILDRNGKEIGRIFVQNRSVISLDKVPQLFIDTLRAGEDSRYWDHDGIDYIGVLRAVKMNWSAGKTTQGASTITQQLARNAYPLQQDTEARGESSMERKMVEAFLARRIEKRYSKKQIFRQWILWDTFGFAGVFWEGADGFEFGGMCYDCWFDQESYEQLAVEQFGVEQEGTGHGFGADVDREDDNEEGV
jgi:membrane carboxypeptidase/penicillin-binding protein